MSSFDLHLYDFHLLEETLEREFPALKRNALLLAIPNINLQIINKKKKIFQAKIKYFAFLSAFGAGVPVPGLSGTIDIGMIIAYITESQIAFCIDNASLQNLAFSAHLTLVDLEAVMTSPLAAKEITKHLIIKILISFQTLFALMAAEEGSRFIPIIGIPAAMILSFISTYRVLTTSLNMVVEDAQRVFTRYHR